MSKLELNTIVKCTKSRDLTMPFIGKVAYVNDNEVVVNILDNDPTEMRLAYSLDFKTRVNVSDIHPIKIKKRKIRIG